MSAGHSRWLAFVESFYDLLTTGLKIPVGPTLEVTALDREEPSGPVIVLCSPHPDDEALVGALPLRAQRDLNARVINCAVTLGSNVERKATRLAELRASCGVLGFELEVPGRNQLGLDEVNLRAKRQNPREWEEKVEAVKRVIESVSPDIVMIPHSKDANETHEGTSEIAREAVRRFGEVREREVLLIETEYWRELDEPNLMVGVDSATEAVLVMAVAQHGGEVARNPYHLTHPARMINNVRRGSERLGGQGATAVDFKFGELYRVSRMLRGGRLVPMNQPLIVPPSDLITVDAFVCDPDKT